MNTVSMNVYQGGAEDSGRKLTCWKESSNNVCLETVIFTWLGRALD